MGGMRHLIDRSVSRGTLEYTHVTCCQNAGGFCHDTD